MADKGFCRCGAPAVVRCGKRRQHEDAAGTGRRSEYDDGDYVSHRTPRNKTDDDLTFATRLFQA